MGIKSPSEYVDFFINLNMGENVSLLSFVNNEKIVLKTKIRIQEFRKRTNQKRNKNFRARIARDINEIGEKKVLRKISKKMSPERIKMN